MTWLSPKSRLHPEIATPATRAKRADSMGRGCWLPSSPPVTKSLPAAPNPPVIWRLIRMVEPFLHCHKVWESPDLHACMHRLAWGSPWRLVNLRGSGGSSTGPTRSRTHAGDALRASPPARPTRG